MACQGRSQPIEGESAPLRMPSKYALNVSLTEHFSDFVASQVVSGRFGTASEVVRAALRLLERDVEEQGGVARRDGRNPTAGRDP